MYTDPECTRIKIFIYGGMGPYEMYTNRADKKHSQGKGPSFLGGGGYRPHLVFLGGDQTTFKILWVGTGHFQNF